MKSLSLLLLLCAFFISGCSEIRAWQEVLSSDDKPTQASANYPVLMVPEGLVLKQWNGELQEVLEDRGYEVYVKPEKNTFIFEFVSVWVDANSRYRVVWPAMIFERNFMPGDVYTMKVQYPRSYQEAQELALQRPLPIWMEAADGTRLEGQLLYVQQSE